VIGFVMPGADISNLSTTAVSMVESLTLNDVIVFSGGTKETGKNDSREALRNILNFIKTNSHTNIVLLNIPHRYDLENWSCVNDEIKVFNRKLVKCTTALFTRHGLHLNKMGKNVLVRNIALICTKIVYRDAKPIYLPWKEINNDHDNEIKKFFGIKDCTVDNVMLEISKPQTLEPQHKSNRQRKFPLDRYDDFLWYKINSVTTILKS
ncbi:hypothetical protein B7P43_G18384, partial [Cryptotermes secundus]